MMTKTLPWLALAACAARTEAPETSSTSSALSAIVANGSFETGDYTGWTLAENSGIPSFGTWALVSENQTISPGASVFDFFDQTFVSEGSPGLPITYHATDGTFLAAQLQNGPENHRMFQTVAMPSCQPLLQWDMQYRNHNGGFDPSSQYIAVNVRDPDTDAVLATPFKTVPGDPLAIGMTPFQIDLTPFSGQTVRIDFEQQVQMFFFDAAYDNVRVVCKGLGAVPGALDFAGVTVGTPSPSKVATVTNFANVPLTASSLAIAGPFVLAAGPSLPLTFQPGESTQVEVVFAPAVPGPATGAVTIQSDDPNGPTTIALAGQGTVPQIPRIDVQPPTLDFGIVRTGPPTVRHAQIANVGGGDLVLGSITVAPPFALAGPVPAVIPSGASVDVAIQLAPSIPGPVFATLSIASNDPATPNATVPATALVVEPAIAVQPGALAFGLQRAGTASAPQTVTIANVGTDTLTIASASVDGPFAVTAPSTTVVAPNAIATIDVRFVPGAAGSATGSLTIVSDAPGSPTLVPLSGTGTEPVLDAGQPQLDFGALRVGATATRTFTLKNVGTAPMAILSAVTTPPFAIASPVPHAVLPGAQATITVAFSPPAAGQAAASAIVTTDAGVAVAALAGAGVQPNISAAPTAIDFGDVRIGTMSAPRSAAIANPGTAALVVTAIAFPPGFVPSPPVALPASIPPGGSLGFDLQFAATGHGVTSGSIAIASDAGPAAIAVSGRGVAPSLVASLPQLDFGPVAIGASAPLDVQLSNPGDAPVTIASATIAGPDYALTATAPTAIAAGATATVTVRFAPTDHGARSAQLAIASDAGPVAIALTGTGSGPRAVIDPPALDLGPANVATAAPARTVTVANSGDTDLAVSAIVVAGAGAADFAATTPVPATVAPGASVTFAFTFTPSAVGARAATATLVTTDPLVPSKAIALAGTGTSPAIAVAPADIDFSGVNVGSSRTLPIAIKNTGSGPLTLASITVGGADAAAFTLDPVALPLVLAPSQSAALHATFAPATIGSATATVSVVSDDPAAPLATIALAGAATSPAVVVTPSDVDFGAQVVGHPSALRQIHVANHGSGPLSVTALAVTGAHSSQFALVAPPSLPVAIAPNGELVLSLRVTTSITGVAAADLQIATDAAAATISLGGLGMAAGLSITPATIDFGTTHAGVRPAPVTVTLANLTAEPIQLLEAVRGGPRPTDYTVSSVAGTLPAGASTTVVVEYIAPAASVSAATITFAASDTTIPQAIVSLGGKTVSTFITTPRDAIDFGPIAVGEASGARTVAITNVTTAPIAIASVVAQDPQFVVTPPSSDPLAPGATMSVAVTFAPDTVGPISSTIAITLAGSAAPELVVAVAGTGEAGDDRGGCSATRSGSLWLALGLVALLRWRARVH